VEFFPTKDENKINESSKKQKEMKKNILKATLVVYNSQKSDVMSDLALANVEALADDGETLTPTECPGGRHLCQWIIYPGGSVTYYDRNGEDTI